MAARTCMEAQSDAHQNVGEELKKVLMCGTWWSRARAGGRMEKCEVIKSLRVTPMSLSHSDEVQGHSGKGHAESFRANQCHSKVTKVHAESL